MSNTPPVSEHPVPGLPATAPPAAGPLVFEQFYLECLSHASYLVGDRSSGRAVVVDPQRDVGDYLAEAKRLGLRIERVIETHVHADFLSGHLELAERTGASISYGPTAEVDFPVELVQDGQRLSLGQVELEVLHTPGHTPESICLLVREHADDEVPYAVLTGDTLFVGDVGRPDLLGSRGHSAAEMARALYHSTRTRLLPLPDATRVYPAHGAGSSCGRSLSTELSCTIGRQRHGNRALAEMSEEAFVALVTDGQPAAPPYFAHASERNRQARPVFDEEQPVRMLTADGVDQARAGGAVVVDTRDGEAFAGGHLPGALNVPLGGRFAELAGEVLDEGDVVVLVGDPGTAVEARNRLARIGFDRVLGALQGGVDELEPALLRPARRLDADAVAELVTSASDPAVALVDVRGLSEVHENGTIPGARHLPLPELVSRIGELTPSQPTLVFCASGGRSAVAASLLRSRGFTDVADLRGGFGAWRGPVEQRLVEPDAAHAGCVRE